MRRGKHRRREFSCVCTELFLEYEYESMRHRLAKMQWALPTRKITQIFFYWVLGVSLNSPEMTVCKPLNQWAMENSGKFTFLTMATVNYSSSMKSVHKLFLHFTTKNLPNKWEREKIYHKRLEVMVENFASRQEDCKHSFSA